MTFRHLRFRSLIILVAFPLTSCKKAVKPPSGGAIAVLIDRTLSVSAHRIGEYPSYFNGSVAGSLHPGERVLIESISDQSTLSDPPFRIVDTTLPGIKAPEWTFNDDYQSYARKCHVALAPQLPAFDSAVAEVKKRTASAFVPDHLASRSYILDGIEDVSEFLNHQTGAKVLVLFTDGIEDSSEYGKTIKFDSPDFWRVERADALIAQLSSQHRIPNLAGTEVYFVGAAAARPEQFRNNQSFWQAYFKAAGIGPGHLHYGHQPSWEESPAPANFESAMCNSASP